MSRKKKPEAEQSVFNRNLAQIIKEKHISLKDLSIAVEVPHSTIHSWVTNAAPTDLKAVQRLAKFLNVSFEALLCGDVLTEEKTSTKIDLRDLLEVPEQSILSGIFQIEIKKLSIKK
jgi:transcriptional regulator with XRE-family HTH domain